MEDSTAQEKTCSKCHQAKAYADFTRSRGSKDGYSNACKACLYQAIRDREKKRRLWLERESEKVETRSEVEAEQGLTKQCIGCGKEKSIEDFTRYPDKRYIDRHARCKDCERFAERQKAQIRREQAEQKRIDASLALAWEERIKQAYQRRHEKHIMKHYGMTPERYQSLLKEQGGVCAICGTDKGRIIKKSLVVDHSHVTGAVRGLLCYDCNMALGFFQDKVESLLQAAEYLRKFQWD